MKRFILFIILIIVVFSFPACNNQGTATETRASSTPSMKYALSSWDIPPESTMSSEEMRKALATGNWTLSIQHSPVREKIYWNSHWLEEDGDKVKSLDNIYRTIVSVTTEYYETHTYIEDEFDCNDMAIGVWNGLLTKTITSVIVVGDLDVEKESFAECDHAWVLITFLGSRLFAVETTNGEIYTVTYDVDKSESFKQYLEGYYFRSPSELRAALKDRW